METQAEMHVWCAGMRVCASALVGTRTMHAHLCTK